MAQPSRTREVRVADPHLSSSANQRLTDALRETFGTDHVEVPEGRPHPSRGEPVPGGVPDAILWLTILGLAVVSIVIPAGFGSGWLWLVPGVMFPLLAGWVVIQGLTGSPRAARQLPITPLVVVVAAAVAICCAIIAIAYH